MGRFAVSVVSLVALLTSPALGADMAVPPPLEKAAFHPVRVYEWTGFYIGVNGGYATGQSRVSFPGALGDSADFTLDGALVGGTVGFNLQAGPIVWGVEGDIGLADISGGAACPVAGHHMLGPQPVARHRARPARLGDLQLDALHHRRYGVRRSPGQRATDRIAEHDARRLDR